MIAALTYKHLLSQEKEDEEQPTPMTPDRGDSQWNLYHLLGVPGDPTTLNRIGMAT